MGGSDRLPAVRDARRCGGRDQPGATTADRGLSPGGWCAGGGRLAENPHDRGDGWQESQLDGSVRRRRLPATQAALWRPCGAFGPQNDARASLDVPVVGVLVASLDEPLEAVIAGAVSAPRLADGKAALPRLPLGAAFGVLPAEFDRFPCGFALELVDDLGEGVALGGLVVVGLALHGSRHLLCQWLMQAPGRGVHCRRTR